MEKQRRVKKNYRIRPDIDAELQGLMALLNGDIKEEEKKITETTVVEMAIAQLCKRFKERLKKSGEDLSQSGT